MSLLGSAGPSGQRGGVRIVSLTAIGSRVSHMNCAETYFTRGIPCHRALRVLTHHGAHVAQTIGSEVQNFDSVIIIRNFRSVNGDLEAGVPRQSGFHRDR